MVTRRELMRAIRRNAELGLYSTDKALDLDKVKRACERVGLSYTEFLNYQHREDS